MWREGTLMKKSRIQQQFDHGAAKYDALGSLQQLIVQDLLQQAISPVEVVVDLGCGTGFGLALLAAAGHECLLGIDIAQSMLEHAQARVPQANLLVADIEAIPLPDNCADLVVSSSALQWCNLPVALSEAVRITKPGGRLLVSTFTRGTLSDWRALWGIYDDDWFVSPLAINECLADLNIAHVEMRTEVYLPRFRSFTDAVASIRGLGAGITSQPGLMSRNKYRAIRQRVEAEIAHKGSFILPYYVTRFTAIKPEPAMAQPELHALQCHPASL